MRPVITDFDLIPQTPASIADRIAEARKAGTSERQIVTDLAEAALHAAEDAAHRLRTYLGDGWNGDPMQTPTTAPDGEDRDRLLLAAMIAARNTVQYTGTVRTMQDIDRADGWDPLKIIPRR
jgi:hypothetical protein